MHSHSTKDISIVSIRRKGKEAISRFLIIYKENRSSIYRLLFNGKLNRRHELRQQYLPPPQPVHEVSDVGTSFLQHISVIPTTWIILKWNCTERKQFQVYKKKPKSIPFYTSVWETHLQASSPPTTTNSSSTRCGTAPSRLWARDETLGLPQECHCPYGWPWAHACSHSFEAVHLPVAWGWGIPPRPGDGLIMGSANVHAHLCTHADVTWKWVSTPESLACISSPIRWSVHSSWTLKKTLRSWFFFPLFLIWMLLLVRCCSGVIVCALLRQLVQEDYKLQPGRLQGNSVWDRNASKISKCSNTGMSKSPCKKMSKQNSLHVRKIQETSCQIVFSSRRVLFTMKLQEF